MLYRKFGKTNEEVSALGFGCMRLPVIDNNPTKIDEEKAIKIIRHAIDEGVNYIDTAYPYHGTGMSSPGESEPFVAKALKDGYREKVKIATKLPSWLIRSREDMDKYLNQQLERLETDKIDFYLIHTLNKALWSMLKALGVTEFLDQAIKDGRIKYAGFSFHDNSVDVFKEIVDSYDWSFCQIQYSYMDEKYQAGKEGLEYAAQKGLGISIMEPLKGGSLANKLPDAAIEAFEQADSQKTPAEWALRWLWNHEGIGVVLSGMNEMEQVIENITIAKDAKEGSLTENEIEIVDEVKDILKQKVKVSCTGCGYCMPCPVGVDIPKNFSYYNDYFRFDDPHLKANTKLMYSGLLSPEEKAENCIECGRCEGHCPQNIAIREQLKDVTSTLATELRL